MSKVIMHIDMDAFFASIEELDNPEYRNKPLIVGSDPKKGKGRGVVSAASYAARKFGVHSAMPISEAYRLCPDGTYILPRMERYAEVSRKIFWYLQKEFPAIEQISVDEAFVDVSGLSHIYGSPEQIGKFVKLQVKKRFSLTASVGIASSKSVAKIASDLEKPDGLTVVKRGTEIDFLATLSLQRIWGIGPVTLKRFNSLGLFTIGDLQKKNERELIEKFGKKGSHYFNMARGIDNRPVEPNTRFKSIAEERTFEVDTKDIPAIKEKLRLFSRKIMKRVRKKGQGKLPKTITLKIRFTGFETHTSSKTIDFFDDSYTLESVSLSLLEKYLPLKKPVRLIGVQVSNFSEHRQQMLFDYNDTMQVKKSRKVDHLIDDLSGRYGQVVSRASDLKKSDTEV